MSILVYSVWTKKPVGITTDATFSKPQLELRIPPTFSDEALGIDSRV